MFYLVLFICPIIYNNNLYYLDHKRKLFPEITSNEGKYFLNFLTTII